MSWIMINGQPVNVFYITDCSLNCKNEDKDIMYSTKQEDSCYELLCQYFGKNNDF